MDLGDLGVVVVSVEHGDGVDADAGGGADRSEAVFEHPGIIGSAAAGFARELDQRWLGFAESEIGAAIEIFETVADAGAYEQRFCERFVVVGHEHEWDIQAVQALDKFVSAVLEWGEVGVDVICCGLPGVEDFLRCFLEIVEIAHIGCRILHRHRVDARAHRFQIWLKSVGTDKVRDELVPVLDRIGEGAVHVK